MKKYSEMTRAELEAVKVELYDKYNAIKDLGLTLNMARGKPAKAQLDLTNGMLEIKDYISEDGTDCRNYGVVEGLYEARKLFADILEVSPENVIVCGASSLNIMYDAVARMMIFGNVDSDKPWCKCEKVKFLCPAPGYDRHFGITEKFGIEMITVKMNEDGPDMDEVEKLVSEDDAIKGIWCVPMYSNPTGITYSDEVVRRFASLKPKAKDFRIFWDNAYCVHHVTDTPDTLLNIFDACKEQGSENMVLEFASTSKITYAGAGISVVAASDANIADIKKHMSVQTIGHDKMNQLRHVKFFGNADNLKAHMQKHRAIIEPKFEVVIAELEKELSPLGIGEFTKPNGGYFISLDVMNGCAKRTVALCKEAGVELTGAGATFPYGKDPEDRNIRIAPTLPPIEELREATELLVLCVKIATVEKLLEA